MSFWKMLNQIEHLQKNLSRGSKNVEFDSFPKFSFLPGVSARSFPMVNIGDDKENVYVEALAPGVDPTSFNVSIAQNVLTISGEKPELKIKEEEYHRNERAAGKFVRTIELPFDVDSGKISAEYKNGILLLTLPKAEESKPKQIEVKVN